MATSSSWHRLCLPFGPVGRVDILNIVYIL